MNLLLNVTFMPNVGIYNLTRLTASEFCTMLKTEAFVSYIGYPSTAKHIEQMTGIVVPISRRRIYVTDGDTLLICRLKYLEDSSTSPRRYEPEACDFEYFKSTYQPQ